MRLKCYAKQLLEVYSAIDTALAEDDMESLQYLEGRAQDIREDAMDAGYREVDIDAELLKQYEEA